MRAERHPEETARLAELRAYGILDTPREAEFDDLVALASRICETPVALVSLMDADRQWFKAAVGVEMPERPYEASLCSHIILQKGLQEVPDLTQDARFADNAVVAGDPNLRFYAGVPLETPGGFPIGTLCVIDTEARTLTDLQRETLRVLARQAMIQIELRRRLREEEAERARIERAVEARTRELREAFEEAERFNYSISHDLRTPLRAISATSRMLLEEAGPALDKADREHLERQNHNARRLGLLIDGLLRLSRLGRVELRRSPLDVSGIAQAVVDEIARTGDAPCRIEIEPGMRGEGDPALVRVVLANLIENACKFSRGNGAVRVYRDGAAFAVSDEGVGFDMAYAKKLFVPFERLVGEDEFPGTGIGLANVERIVRRHDGRVWAKSAPGEGATFWFTLDAGTPLLSGGEGPGEKR